MMQCARSLITEGFKACRCGADIKQMQELSRRCDICSASSFMLRVFKGYGKRRALVALIRNLYITKSRASGNSNNEFILLHHETENTVD
jgi:hypothetical protein